MRKSNYEEEEEEQYRKSIDGIALSNKTCFSDFTMLFLYQNHPGCKKDPVYSIELHSIKHAPVILPC